MASVTVGATEGAGALGSGVGETPGADAVGDVPGERLPVGAVEDWAVDEHDASARASTAAPGAAHRRATDLMARSLGTLSGPAPAARGLTRRGHSRRAGTHDVRSPHGGQPQYQCGDWLSQKDHAAHGLP